VLAATRPTAILPVAEAELVAVSPIVIESTAEALAWLPIAIALIPDAVEKSPWANE